MNVIIIEDQILFREFTVSILTNDFGLNVSGQYDDGESGLEACLEQRPDLVVLDIKIKKLGGLTVFNRLKDQAPDMKVIIVSAHFNPEIVKATVERGVNGLVTKNCTIESLKNAIGQILKGAVYYSPEAYNLLRQPITSKDYNDSLEMLTPREKDVLQMVGEGYSSKEIAKSFGLSVRTIDAHRSNIMRKLKLRGATDMTRLAVKLKLVSQD
ncbi:MAG: response regulator transcription factor [Opitutales bacterium]|jgi:DNA-binding NarL/FixJ family response regulator|nr:response regulator transcription factor [Opitutales bacterium]